MSFLTLAFKERNLGDEILIIGDRQVRQINYNPWAKSVRCLVVWSENPVDKGAWHAAVHGVAKSWT